MNHQGAPGRHRAPTLYRPDRTHLHAMILLAATSGTMAAVAQQAHTNGDTPWMWAFALSGLTTTICYLRCAWLWFTLSTD